MLTDQQRDELLANRPYETVTKESIEGKILNHAFWRPHENSTLTVCTLTLSNGFEVVGQSACANKKNFDPDLGKKLAYDDAVNKIWMLEGYLLREGLHLQSQTDQTGPQQADAVLAAQSAETVQVAEPVGSQGTGLPPLPEVEPITEAEQAEAGQPENLHAAAGIQAAPPAEQPAPQVQDLSPPEAQPAEGSTQPQQAGVQQ